MNNDTVPLQKSEGKIDKVFETSDNTEYGFKFDKQVATVFDDMVSRSVPLYTEAQKMIVNLAKEYIQDNTYVYDIGCSTGTTLLLLAQNSDKEVTFLGIDSSIEMIEEAEIKLKSLMPNEKRIKYKSELVTANTVFVKQSVCIVSLVLQFIRPIKRKEIVQNIYNSLTEKGAFILFEKTLITDNDDLNRQFIKLHYEYKKSQGYSETEIAKKRLALENVLIPYSSKENMQMLKNVGFKVVEQFFQYYNFSAYIAIK